MLDHTPEPEMRDQRFERASSVWVERPRDDQPRHRGRVAGERGDERLNVLVTVRLAASRAINGAHVENVPRRRGRRTAGGSPRERLSARADDRALAGRKPYCAVQGEQRRIAYADDVRGGPACAPDIQKE